MTRRAPRPRLGFLGVGWIGAMRLEALVASRTAEVVAVADPDPAGVERAARHVPGARVVEGLEGLLAQGVEGVVIATPSALHAEQARAALGAGAAVFVQKPLARSGAECAEVIEAARRADRLLAVDWSYRFLAGADKLRTRIGHGELGEVFAVDLTFHNAYGPDKPWFYDRSRSGGGCLVDLGSHLVDLALWMLRFPATRHVASRLLAAGQPLPGAPRAVEDYATALLETETGATLRLACSWNLAAGRDAVIEAAFYGTRGGGAIRNVEGSFYDFVVEHYRGTRAELLAAPPDAWGGRALVDWAQRLARDGGFDPEVMHTLEVARLLDAVYASCAS